MKICLFDPGLENNNGSPSANLGDLIIQEAVTREIKSLFKDCEILHISTHTFPRLEHMQIASKCDLMLVGGTNLLSSNMYRYKQWKFSLKQMLQTRCLRRIVLFGVGWQNYQNEPNFLTKIILNNILSRKLLHSVRDNYTKTMLKSAGIQNVVNTSCPTMWPLLNIRPEEFPTKKSETVLVMLTDYAPNPELDKKLFELVFSKYEKVVVWPQGRGDKEYISNLVSNLSYPYIMLDHSFTSFKNFLNSGLDFDYIGTRLHGGIKCLVNKKRALILAIDNRAKEIAKDTNIPTVDRSDLFQINQWIDGYYQINININIDDINRWKSQFIKLTNMV